MRRLFLALPIIAALAAAGCGGADDSNNGQSSAAGGKKTLSLVAYSTPQVVYDQAIPAFQKTEAGAGVSFKQSYGGSGDQSRAVESGLAADVVNFSLEPDMTRLVDAGLVDADWKSAGHKGIVSDSVVVSLLTTGMPL